MKSEMKYGTAKAQTLRYRNFSNKFVEPEMKYENITMSTCQNLEFPTRLNSVMRYDNSKDTNFTTSRRTMY